MRVFDWGCSMWLRIGQELAGGAFAHHCSEEIPARESCQNEDDRQRLMSKLDLHDTAGLTRYAIAAGIIESSVQVTIV